MADVTNNFYIDVQGRVKGTEKITQASKALEKVNVSATKATKAGERLTKSNQKLAASMGKVGGALKGMAAGFVGYLSIRAIGGAINRTIEFGDELDKVGKKLGFGSEALQRWQFAAKLAGIETTTFNMAVQRMVRRAAEAKAGTGELLPILEELGINVQEFGAMKPEGMMKVLGDAMKGLKTDSERLRLAFKAFDSEGVQMVNLLGEGGVKAQEMADGMSKSAVMTQEQVDKTAALKESMTGLNTELSGVANSLVSELVPALQAAVPLLKEGAKGFAGFMQGASNFFSSGLIEDAAAASGLITFAQARLNKLQADKLRELTGGGAGTTTTATPTQLVKPTAGGLTGFGAAGGIPGVPSSQRVQTPGLGNLGSVSGQNRLVGFEVAGIGGGEGAASATRQIALERARRAGTIVSKGSKLQPFQAPETSASFAFSADQIAANRESDAARNFESVRKEIDNAQKKTEKFDTWWAGNQEKQAAEQLNAQRAGVAATAGIFHLMAAQAGQEQTPLGTVGSVLSSLGSIAAMIPIPPLQAAGVAALAAGGILTSIDQQSVGPALAGIGDAVKVGGNIKDNKKPASGASNQGSGGDTIIVQGDVYGVPDLEGKTNTAKAARESNHITYAEGVTA